MSGFWVGGHEALRVALQNQFDARLGALKQELRLAVSPDEAQAIRRQIAQLRADFQGRGWHWEYLLF